MLAAPNNRCLVLACSRMFMQKKVTGNSTLLQALDTYTPAAKLTSFAFSCAARVLTVVTLLMFRSLQSQFWLHHSQDSRSRSQYGQPNDTNTLAARSIHRHAIALAGTCMPKAVRLEQKERRFSNRCFPKQRARQRSPKTTSSAQNY